MQIQFDPFKEHLDLPAFLVQISDHGGWDIQRVGHKRVGDVGFSIQATYFTKNAVYPFELDLLIQQNFQTFAPSALGAGNGDGIVLQTRDQTDTIIGQFLIPGRVGIAPVKNNIGI